MHTHHDRSRPATPLSGLIFARGDSWVLPTGPELRGLANEDRTVTVACVSETRHAATWTGVPVLGPFADAGLGDKTTHPLVESADGYQVCIDVCTIFDAVVACARDGAPISEEHDYEMRFITPDVDGSWTVKGVHAVEVLILDPTTNPESFEDIFKKP